MMAPWSFCIFFVPLALGDSMTTQQVRPFAASLTSELQRLLPDKSMSLEPSQFNRIPENVTALLPHNVSNSPLLGLLSAFGTADPNGFVSCLEDWLKSTPAKDIYKVGLAAFDLVALLDGPVVAYACYELSGQQDAGECIVLGALVVPVMFVIDPVSVAFDETLASLVLCILHIKPPGKVTMDSLKAFAKDKQQMASFERLLRDGHGFEAGFKAGSVLQKAWSQKEARQQSVLV